MEFKFNLNDIFKEPIVEIDSTFIPPGFKGDKRTLWDTQAKVSQVVNAMGEASATAQSLTKPITTSDRLRNSEHKLYFLIDQSANSGKGAVTGMLKIGQKGLYVFDREGNHYQVSPPCVLDFYVHESRQRQGLGKHLFEHMLQKVDTDPVKMAIDRPSDKFLAFLDKHYHLQSPVKQMNNYVVFDGFFPRSSQTPPKVVADNSIKSKKASANGLQHHYQTSPYGRYAATRPPCSMGQIIHNDTPVIPKSQEATGVRSEPVTNVQTAPHQNNYSYPTQPETYVTQSTPNMHYPQNVAYQQYHQPTQQGDNVHNEDNLIINEQQTMNNMQTTQNYQYQYQPSNQPQQINLQPMLSHSQQNQNTYYYDPNQQTANQLQGISQQMINQQMPTDQTANQYQSPQQQVYQYQNTPPVQQYQYQTQPDQQYVVAQQPAVMLQPEKQEPLLPVVTDTRQVPLATQSLPNQHFNAVVQQPTINQPNIYHQHVTRNVQSLPTMQLQPTRPDVQHQQYASHANLQSIPENAVVNQPIISNTALAQPNMLHPMHAQPVMSNPTIAQQHNQPLGGQPMQTNQPNLSPQQMASNPAFAQQMHHYDQPTIVPAATPQSHNVHFQVPQTAIIPQNQPPITSPAMAQHYNLTNNLQPQQNASNTVLAQPTYVQPTYNNMSVPGVYNQPAMVNPTVQLQQTPVAQQQYSGMTYTNQPQQVTPAEMLTQPTHQLPNVESSYVGSRSIEQRSNDTQAVDHNQQTRQNRPKIYNDGLTSEGVSWSRKKLLQNQQKSQYTMVGHDRSVENMRHVNENTPDSHAVEGENIVTNDDGQRTTMIGHDDLPFGYPPQSKIQDYQTRWTSNPVITRL